MLNSFTYNGKSTGDFGLLVSAVNPYDAPSRKVDKVGVPYRNGDLLLDTGVYNNILVSYDISLMYNTQVNADSIRNWLLGSRGYNVLTDTYNPDIYRIGAFYNDIEYVLSALYRYGTARITFDCIAPRYLIDNEPIQVSVGTTTIEATHYNQPIIQIEEEGLTGTIKINNNEIVVNETPVYINSQTMQCYYYGTNMNASVELLDFPVLQKGSNTIETDIAFTLVPNWWKL